MKNKILSFLLIMILVLASINVENTNASTYSTKTRSVELIDYYGTATDHTDSDILFGTSNYIGDNTDVEGVYEEYTGKNLINLNLNGNYNKVNAEYEYYNDTLKVIHNLDFNTTSYVTYQVELLPNTTYTLSANLKNSSGVVNDLIGVWNSTVSVLYSQDGSDPFELTFTTDSNTSYKILFYVTGSDIGDYIEYENIQLELGSTITSYEANNGLKKLSGVTDLSTSIFNDTQYDRVSYIDSLDSGTDYYQNRTLRQVFGDSLYHTGKTNLAVDNVSLFSPSYNESENIPISYDSLNNEHIITYDDSYAVPNSSHYSRTSLSNLVFENNMYYISLDYKAETNTDDKYRINFYEVGLYLDSGLSYYRTNDYIDWFTTFAEDYTDYTSRSLIIDVEPMAISSGFINASIFEDTTAVYNFGVGEYVILYYKDVMVYDLTTLFSNNYEPSIRQFENLKDAYIDVTDNGKGVYQQYGVDQKQDDYTYVKLINVEDTHFEFNLTEAFTDKGYSIPDVEDLADNLVYDSVNDKYYYNIDVVEEDVVQLECRYTASNLVSGGVMSEARIEDHVYYSSGQINSIVEEGFIGVTNLIVNGDFSDGYNNWTPNELNTSEYGVESGVLYFTKSGLGTSTMLSQASMVTTDEYYLSYESISSSDLVGTGWAGLNTLLATPSVSMIKNSIIWTSIYDFPSTSYRINDQRSSSYDRVYIDNIIVFDLTDDFINVPDITTFENDYLNGVSYVDGFSSDIVIDLTSLYGKGNEPTLAEFEAVVDLSTVQATYPYNDNCNGTMIQNNGIYQYLSDQSDNDALVDLAFVDTIYGIEDLDVNITIKKYDLNMVELGVLFEGRTFSNEDVNNDGFKEHNFNYSLPAPLETESGYIYQVINGESGLILSAGYVYSSLNGSGFVSSSSGIRTSTEAVGMNDVVYNTGSGYLFEPDKPLDYQVIDGEEIVIHYRFGNVLAPQLTFYNELSLQTMSIELLDIYDAFTGNASTITNEGYVFIKVNSELPLLLNYLDANNVELYNSNINNAITVYNESLKGIFNNIGFADNYGIYTYNLNDGISTVYCKGETPIYYMNDFNTMTLKSHLARVGNPFVVVINQNDYLGSIYEVQYIFDTNTLVTNVDLIVNGDNPQELSIDIFKGISGDVGILKYNLTNNDDDYKNGSLNDAYDVYLSDQYNLKIPNTIGETRDKFLDDINFNNTFGKLLISMIVIAIVSVGVFIKTKNTIATMIGAILTLALMFVLGFLEAWLILFIVMILVITLWFVFNRAKV